MPLAGCAFLRLVLMFTFQNAPQTALPGGSLLQWDTCSSFLSSPSILPAVAVDPTAPYSSRVHTSAARSGLYSSWAQEVYFIICGTPITGTVLKTWQALNKCWLNKWMNKQMNKSRSVGTGQGWLTHQLPESELIIRIHLLSGKLLSWISPEYVFVHSFLHSSRKHALSATKSQLNSVDAKMNNINFSHWRAYNVGKWKNWSIDDYYTIKCIL